MLYAFSKVLGSRHHDRSASCCAVLYYAFYKVELNRVQADVFDGNTASIHVLTKCGMQLEGIARQKYYKNGAFIDAAQYAVLRSEFKG